MKTVLFVCTANQCRSPMAEAMFRQMVAATGGEPDWRIASAGTWAVPGMPALPLARQTMQRRGLNVDGHRSQPISAELMDAYSAIVVMTRSHREALQAEFPQAGGRVILMSELAGPEFDVEDPVGGSAQVYEDCAREMAGLLQAGYGRLEQLAGGV